MISIDNIKDAKKRISNYIKETDIKLVDHFKKNTGVNLYLKLENFQNSGSFKMRGACNKILTLTEEEKKKGVICASAGNHAQGVAFSSTSLGIKSTIIMPKTTPLAKIKSTLEYGGNVVQFGDIYDDAYLKALEIQKETGATFIHPFDDLKVIEGQATIGLEILEQLEKIDYVVVSIGGGGLLAGISYVIKQLKPSIKVIGVQTENAPAMKISFYNKKNTPHSVIPTIADGIAVAKPGALTFDIIKENVDEIVTVSEKEIAESMVYLMEKCKIISEGAGAASVSAVLSGKIGKKGDNVMAIVSGGNVDISLIEKIINNVLLSSGRRFKYSTTIKDKSGELMKFINTISNNGGNIVSINQSKYAENLGVNERNLDIIIDSKDENHRDSIINVLNSLN